MVWNNNSYKHFYSQFKNTLKELTKEFDSITNQSDFNTYLKKKNSKNNKCPDIILINVELFWSKSGNYEGYEIAFQLLEKFKNVENPPNIQFFSFVDRKTLYQKAPKAYLPLIKSFNHKKLPNTEIDLNTFNVDKFQYLFKYALKESGILDTILHRLGTDKSNMTDKSADELAQKYCKETQHALEICGADIKKHIEDYQLNKMDSVKFINTLYDLLFIQILKIQEKTDSSNNTNKNISKYKILLLEDDFVTLNKLKVWFEKYFDVFSTNNGEIAKNELEKNGSQYDALVTDLELLDEEGVFDQPVQGIEIISYTRRMLPNIAIKVITGLGQKGIQLLLPDFKEADLLKKTRLPFILSEPGFMEYAKEIEKSILERSRYKNMNGPNRFIAWDDINGGKEGGKLKRFYYELKYEHNNDFLNMWSQITETVLSAIPESKSYNPDTIVNIAVTTGSNNSREPLKNKTADEKRDFLRDIIILRLLLFRFCKPDSSFYFYKEKKNKELSNDCFIMAYNFNYSQSSSKDIKDFIRLIGFHTRDLNDKSSSAVIESIEFFDEEQDFINENYELFYPKGDFYKNYKKICSVFEEMMNTILNNKYLFKRNYSKYLNNNSINKEIVTLEIIKNVLFELKKEIPDTPVGNDWESVMKGITEIKDFILNYGDNELNLYVGIESILEPLEKTYNHMNDIKKSTVY